MGQMEAFNETTVRQRRENERAEHAEEARRENRDFTQIYPKGWHRIRVLMDQNPAAARLWCFLAEHMDGSGVLVASRETLGEALGVSTKTITRHTSALEEMGALVVLRVGVGANAYALNPEEVWKAWDANKTYAAFHTRTLVSKTANKGVRKRLTYILKPNQPPLPFDEE